jgi:hypothetical protein
MTGRPAAPDWDRSATTPAMGPAVADDGRQAGRTPADVADSSGMATASPAGRAVLGETRRTLTAEDARRVAVELAREAQASGRRLTTSELTRATGRSDRQARRLLKGAMAQVASDSAASARESTRHDEHVGIASRRGPSDRPHDAQSSGAPPGNPTALTTVRETSLCSRNGQILRRSRLRHRAG